MKKKLSPPPKLNTSTTNHLFYYFAIHRFEKLNCENVMLKKIPHLIILRII